MGGKTEGLGYEEAAAGAKRGAGRVGFIAMPAGFTAALVVDVREQEGPKMPEPSVILGLRLFLPTLFVSL